MHRQWVGLFLALAFVSAACGREGGGIDVERVISTPSAAPTVEVTPSGSPKASGTPGTSGTPTGSPGGTTNRTAEPEPTITTKLADVKIKLTLVTRISAPTALAVRANDDAMYVASKRGKVYRVLDRQQKVVLDIADEISGGSEQGLLGLAFTPNGRILVVNFTDKDDASITRAYDYNATANVVTESTGKNLWRIPKPAEVHNAGTLAFGLDGYLYSSLGDGGLSGDPDNNAQSLGTMLGKIHRVDVQDDRTYKIPPDNPFVKKPGARKEIWAYGFRNPWRFSFDKKTGDLWISDVGRDTKEEIDFEPEGSKGGRNYGWNRMEGSVPYQGKTPPEGHVPPIYEYNHTDTRCVVIGGYVYRGDDIPDLRGAYLFSDYCEGGVEALRIKDGKVEEHRHFQVKTDHISAFGQDAAGEVYALALVEGAVYKIGRP